MNYQQQLDDLRDELKTLKNLHRRSTNKRVIKSLKRELEKANKKAAACKIKVTDLRYANKVLQQKLNKAQYDYQALTEENKDLSIKLYRKK